MELIKNGKKVTLKSDVQITAYKKAGWTAGSNMIKQAHDPALSA